jgi:hypothetical protein
MRTIEKCGIPPVNCERRIETLPLSRSPFIEDYLKMGTVQHPESVAMFDLLWKYYEKNRQYVAAAKILSKLSDKHRYVYLHRKLVLAFP